MFLCRFGDIETICYLPDFIGIIVNKNVVVVKVVENKKTKTGLMLVFVLRNGGRTRTRPVIRQGATSDDRGEPLLNG